MTAKEKAKELIEKYTKIKVVVLGCGKEECNPCIIGDNMNQIATKQCAIIAVDEILEQIDTIDTYLGNLKEQLQFFYSVKTELNKL